MWRRPTAWPEQRFKACCRTQSSGDIPPPVLPQIPADPHLFFGYFLANFLPWRKSFPTSYVGVKTSNPTVIPSFQCGFPTIPSLIGRSSIRVVSFFDFYAHIHGLVGVERNYCV
ncbi:unnamed protein product [Victoria cruziana]